MQTPSAAWKRTLFCERLQMCVLDWTGHRLLECRLTLTLQTYIMGGKASWCRSEFLRRMSSSYIQRCNRGRDPAVTYWPTTRAGVGRLVFNYIANGIWCNTHSLTDASVVLAETVVLPSQPHSIWFLARAQTGTTPRGKDGKMCQRCLT